MLCHMWDLGSLTRDQTCTPCTGSMEQKTKKCFKGEGKILLQRRTPVNKRKGNDKTKNYYFTAILVISDSRKNHLKRR